MIYDLYPLALDCGIEIPAFWEMSVIEIQDYITSYERKYKQRLSELHFLSKDIAQYVNLVINGSDEHEPFELWDYFPGLFEKEREETEKRMQDRAMAAYKAQMKDYAYRHNHSRMGGEAP